MKNFIFKQPRSLPFRFFVFVLLLCAGGISGAVSAQEGSAETTNQTVDITAAEIINTSPVDEEFEQEAHLGAGLPLWAGIPFVGLLLSIAFIPLINMKFWHHWYPAIVAFWALLFAVPFVASFGSDGIGQIGHIIMVDYVPFLILVGGLYVISGGIVVRGSFAGTPLANAGFLAVGALLASIIGTTGASMLLIRPLLRSLAWRKNKAHTIVFFIFLVGNVGGSLTPIGDPPLFLGFLHGVPFFWTLRLLPHMAFVAALLLVAYFVMDTILARKDTRPITEAGSKIRFSIGGWHNLILNLGVIAAIIMTGIAHLGEVDFFGLHLTVQDLLSQAIILSLVAVSLLTTKREHRLENAFEWGPIKEVAILFIGIFTTMIAPLDMLRAAEKGALSFLVSLVNEPYQYFWMTGFNSSLIDNAPTYLTFFNTALGRFFPGMPESEAVRLLISSNSGPAPGVSYADYLIAISAGAVFMGALTYIGNAPNLMIKTIAESQGVKMPSFFGYVFKYGIPFLLVTLVIMSLIFF